MTAILLLIHLNYSCVMGTRYSGVSGIQTPVREGGERRVASPSAMPGPRTVGTGPLAELPAAPWFTALKGTPERQAGQRVSPQPRLRAPRCASRDRSLCKVHERHLGTGSAERDMQTEVSGPGPD